MEQQAGVRPRISTEGSARGDTIDRLRDRIARIGVRSPGGDEPGTRPRIGFGLDSIDRRLGGGLATGALHEILGEGPDTEHGTAASLLVAGLLARALAGQPPGRQVLWAMRDDDLYPPGLAAVGLPPQRLILAECGRSVTAVMEEALRYPALCAVVGEIEGGLGLTASRRLQLAAEASGVTALAIRRSCRFDDPALLAPSAAMSRWRIAVLPGAGTSALLDDRPLWRLELLRSRTGSVFHTLVQACDAEGRLADAPDMRRPTPDRLPVPAFLADRPMAWRQVAGRAGPRRTG